MCELFAISSRLPATVSLSLETLAEHGGGSAPHADGDTLFVQADQRYQQDGGTRPPGLHMLNRRCRAPRETVSGGGVSVTSDIQAVTLLASVPLTDEDWQPLPKNTILVLSQGEVVARA